MYIKWIGLALLTISTYSHASQCKVDVENEVHLDGNRVEVYQQGEAKVLIDKDNNVFINGEKLALDEWQHKAVDSYREKMNEYVPRAKDIANNGADLAKDIVDDVSASFNDSQAFNNVKSAIDDFYTDLESRYYQDGEFILKENAFGDAFSHWKKDFDGAMEKFNGEFFSSAFSALSEKMKTEGGINFTELQKQLGSLKDTLKEKIEGQSEEIRKEAQQYCEQLKDVASEEQKLHEKIPALKDYPVFLI
ncbi:chemotaxis protein [Vibrio sp. vnigr-6D03]|uniref:YggN family protein n=1 Tax=Vibrio sp. vnigr-6D03 TaxID=2058088 RepID=UPI000C3243BC|nr:YggN family protein [Vibrio sp. vnigr-6D03]PKF78427.1 chemotaxis protein [Vibrio sp. vnigr-6D03]